MLSYYKQTPNDAYSILESDDDLPDSYEEPSEIPAYLNDTRFDNIELPWLANCKPVKLTKKPQERKTCKEEPAAPARTQKNSIEEQSSTNEKDKKILISQGILTKRDLFFIKSIEDYCSEATLIWFIESLKSKPVQSRFRRSCLAKEFCYDNSSDGQLLFDRSNANYYFDLVVSKQANSCVN